jgi:hypothetical protein
MLMVEEPAMIGSVSAKALGRLIDLRTDDMQHLNLYRSTQYRKTTPRRMGGDAFSVVPPRSNATLAMLAAVNARNQRAINLAGLNATRSEISKLLSRAKLLANANTSKKLSADEKQANQRQIDSILSRVARMIDTTGPLSDGKSAFKICGEIRDELLRQDSTPDQPLRPFSAPGEPQYSVLA